MNQNTRGFVKHKLQVLIIQWTLVIGIQSYFFSQQQNIFMVLMIWLCQFHIRESDRIQVKFAVQRFRKKHKLTFRCHFDTKPTMFSQTNGFMPPPPFITDVSDCFQIESSSQLTIVAAQQMFLTHLISKQGSILQKLINQHFFVKVVFSLDI